MSSESFSVKDGNRNVNITINHYHNEVQQPNIFREIGLGFGNMLALSMIFQGMNTLPRPEDYKERNIRKIEMKDNIITKNFNSDNVIDAEYEVHDEYAHIGDVIISNIVTSEKEKIPILELKMSNREENENFVTLSLKYSQEIKDKIKQKLSNLGGFRTDIFLCNIIPIKNYIRVLYTENNLCETILSKFDKKHVNFVVFDEEIGQKLGINFIELLEKRGIDILIEMNKIFKIEILWPKTVKNKKKFKLIYIQDI